MSGSAREAINEQPGYEWSRHGTKSIQHMVNLNSLASQKTMCNERRTCCNDIMKLRCRKTDSMLCSIRKYHLSGTALVHTPFIHVTICPFICSYIHSSTPQIAKYFHLFSFYFWFSGLSRTLFNSYLQAVTTFDLKTLQLGDDVGCDTGLVIGIPWRSPAETQDLNLAGQSTLFWPQGPS